MTPLLHLRDVCRGGSTTVTTLDLSHKQEVTHGAGGAAVCSLNCRMHPRLVGVNVFFFWLLQFPSFKHESLCVLLRFCQDTSGTERKQASWPPVTDQHSTTKQTLDWRDWDWIWTRPDQTRTIHSRSGLGCCLKGRIREKNRGDIAHTRAASEPEGGTQP